MRYLLHGKCVFCGSSERVLHDDRLFGPACEDCRGKSLAECQRIARKRGSAS